MAENVAAQLENLNVGGNPLAEAEALFGEVNESETIVRTVERTIEAKRETFKNAGDVAREHAAYLTEISEKLKRGAEMFVKKYNAQVDAIADCLMEINHSYSFLHYLSLTKQRPGGTLAMERARAEARAARALQDSGVEDNGATGGTPGGRSTPSRRASTSRDVTGGGGGGSGVATGGVQRNEGSGTQNGGEAVAETEEGGTASSETSGDDNESSDSEGAEGGDAGGDAEMSSAPSAFESTWDGEMTNRNQRYNSESTGMVT